MLSPITNRIICRSIFFSLFFIISYHLSGQCGPTPIAYNGLAVALPPSGSVSLEASLLDAGSIDGCQSGGLTFSFSDDPLNQMRSFNCSDSPSTLIDLWAIDQNGNKNYVGTYLDLQNQPPLCPPNTSDCGPVAIAYNGLAVDLSAGPVILSAAAFDAGSLDLCNTGSLTLEVGYAGSGFFDPSIVIDCNTGFVALIDLRVTDGLGNQSIVRTYILTNDNLDFCGGNSPITPCGPSPVLMNGIALALPADGQVALPAATVFLEALDGCATGNIQTTITNSGQSPDFNTSGLLLDCGNLETLIIEGHIRDNAGNTTFAGTFVLVQDNIAPEITCVPGLAVELQAPGLMSVFAADFIGSLTENCPNVQFSFSSDPSDVSLLVSCLDIGVKPLTIWATDLAGNQTQCQTEVTIQDDIVDCDVCTGDQYDLTGTINPDYYRASDYIAASGTIDQFAFFQATNQISLLPGFSAPAGVTLSARIAACTAPLPILPQINPEDATLEKMTVEVFPNPISAQASIRITLPTEASLRVYITDQTGRLLELLADFNAMKDKRWEGIITKMNRPAGMYFLHVESGNSHQVKKLVWVDR